MKQLIEFIKKYSDAPKGKIIFFTILSGAAYALALSVINTAAENVSTGNDALEVRLFFMFIIIFVLHIYAKKFSMDRSIILAEEIIRSVRVNIIGKIRHTELQFIEKTGNGLIYARLTEDTETLSQSAPYIVMAAEGSVSLIAVFLYIALQSPPGFFLIILLLGLSMFIYILEYIPARKKLELSRIKEAEFFERLDDVLSGFKEIRINYQKNEELFIDLSSISKETEQLKIGAQVSLNSSFIIMNAAYFIMIAGIIFILPVLDVIENSVVIHLVSSLLFLWGPLIIAFRSIPQFMMATVSIQNINRLEARIDDFDTYVPEKKPEAVADFKEITLDSIKFCYTDQNEELLFEMGPLDFRLKKGEVVFIVGGNGSGKSTLMKLLTGLYYPEKGGKISIDQKRVTRETYQSYRELFSTIFTDFHLFKKLYGVGEVDEDEVNRLLRNMELNNKTGYADNRFTNIGLSTGQKKRIAYITCLLEDKPVYVFDEWAADQDPEFRKNFYEKFLEDMRIMNKTIIAVSHDDRYFDRADRVIKMEMGKIVTLT